MAERVCGEVEAVEEVMSLLAEAMEDCVMIDRKSVPDGYGGIEYQWDDGATFKAAITLDTSTQARLASVQGVNDLYTVTTTKGVNLQYHDVFRRVESGKILRVTSDGNDKRTPASASLDMRQVSAEEWELK